MPYPEIFPNDANTCFPIPIKEKATTAEIESIHTNTSIKIIPFKNNEIAYEWPLK